MITIRDKSFELTRCRQCSAFRNRIPADHFDRCRDCGGSLTVVATFDIDGKPVDMHPDTEAQQA